MGCNQSKSLKQPNYKQKKLTVKNIKQIDTKFKIVMLGSSSVGKTSLATKYCIGANTNQFGPTVGGVYFKKDYKLRSGQNISQNIWDTAGQQKYRSMASLYYRDADVVMLVFDLTDLESFKQLQYWIGELDYRIEKKDVNVIVIGNKSDLPGRIVNSSQVKAWLKNYKDFSYVEVSAETGKGVDELFELATKIFLEKFSKKNAK